MTPTVVGLMGRTVMQALIWCAAWKSVEVGAEKLADKYEEFREKRQKPKRGRPKGSRNKPKTA